MPDAKFYCGTSGFAYRSWKPDFYGPNLAPSERLAYYATRLNAVEVSYSNRLTSKSKLEQWVAATPSGFLFLLRTRLDFEGAEERITSLWESLGPLRREQRLGPILFQVLSHAKTDHHRLLRFLSMLPTAMQVAFEFRNSSWFDENTYGALRKANASLCLTESVDLETPWVLTADFVYLRLRKPEYIHSNLISMQYRVEQYLANAYPTFAILQGGKSAAGALSAEKLLIGQKAMGATS